MFKIITTEEELAKQELVQIERMSNGTLQQFINQTKRAYELFWFGKVSPVIKAKILGTEAVAMFTASAQAQGFIKLLNPDYEELAVPENYEIVWGKDGSCVITEKPVEEEIIKEE